MTFRINDSPLAGRRGAPGTSDHSGGGTRRASRRQARDRRRTRRHRRRRCRLRNGQQPPPAVFWKLESVAQPRALVAVLRPYQLRGLAWLAGMTELGLGGCLADDMGLGKTVQVIALHLHRMQNREVPRAVSGRDEELVASVKASEAMTSVAPPMLVVCPTSLLGNWEREVRRFAPTARAPPPRCRPQPRRPRRRRDRRHQLRRRPPGARGAWARPVSGSSSPTRPSTRRTPRRDTARALRTIGGRRRASPSPAPRSRTG